jgi:cytochrome c oxidase subunit 1
MLFSLGFVAMFVIGGLSGVTHAVVPADWEQTDTYYIVAHFHYVLFGGAIFGLFSAVYYWFPKVFGFLLREGLGKLHFWLMFIGFNLTFGPFHLLGLEGMPRRIYTYPNGMGWNFWNMVSTIGAFTIATSIAIFILNVIASSRKREEAGPDPWDARTLEWSIPSPPPEHNFDEIPVVRHRDDWWNRKYAPSPEGAPVRVFAGGANSHDANSHEEPHGHIHLPSPSYFPLFAAVGLPVMAYGVVSMQPVAATASGVTQALTTVTTGAPHEMASVLAIVAGGVITLLGFFGWVLEPQTAEDES